jgi:hypothetical protein
MTTGALLAVLLVAGTASADPIDDLVQRQVQRAHIPGVAVAVVDDGKVTKLQGYGLANLEWAAPVGPDTTFQLASTTKLFTGILLLRLVEKGQLALEVGAAGVPGGSLPLLVGILAMFGVPGEGIALILGIDRILDMARTTVNVTGDLVATVYVARSEGVWNPSMIPVEPMGSGALDESPGWPAPAKT